MSDSQEKSLRVELDPDMWELFVFICLLLGTYLTLQLSDPEATQPNRRQTLTFIQHPR